MLIQWFCVRIHTIHKFVIVQCNCLFEFFFDVVSFEFSYSFSVINNSSIRSATLRTSSFIYAHHSQYTFRAIACKQRNTSTDHRNYFHDIAIIQSFVELNKTHDTSCFVEIGTKICIFMWCWPTVSEIFHKISNWRSTNTISQLLISIIMGMESVDCVYCRLNMGFSDTNN